MLTEAILTENAEHWEPDLRLAAELAVALRVAHRERSEPGGGLAPAGFALFRAVAGEA